jgi:hypothetical protein
MIYRYKDYVTITNIIGNDDHRFILEADLKDGDSSKRALAIMQNPSKATKEVSDQTVSRVLEVMHNSGYGKVCVANLIPFYATDSATIREKSKNEVELYKINDEHIKSKIDGATKIFVAWGGCNSFDKELYESRVTALKNMLGDKKAYCYKINKNGTPVHPSRNQWGKDLTENDFIEYYFG